MIAPSVARASRPARVAFRAGLEARATLNTMPAPVTIVILAAGLGTRMKSRRAKVLHRAGGKTLVGHVVDTALQLAPAERIFVVVGHQADEVRKSIAVPGVG